MTDEGRTLSMRKLAVLLISLTAIAGCGGTPTEGVSPPAASATVPNDTQEDGAQEVAIADFAFTPGELIVESGTTIRWINKDDIAHTTTSGKPKKQGIPGVSKDRDARPDGVFDSGNLELDEVFEFTAKEPGSYGYFCAIHAGMAGRIVVR